MNCKRFYKFLFWLFSYSVFATEINIGRLRYSGGGDWYSNPSSLPNLLKAFSRDTKAQVALREKVVSLQDNSYRTVPIIYFTGHGKIELSQKERENLREFLKNGGFLFADDNFGMDPYIRKELNQLFPNAPLREIPCTHVVFRKPHKMPHCLPKIHEHYGGPPKAFGIFLNGRMVAFYGYNTDLGDGWEDPDVHDTPAYKHDLALKMGVNVLWYALNCGLLGE